VKRAHSRCTSSESAAKKVWRRASVSLMPACACSRRACTCRGVGPGQQRGACGVRLCAHPSAGGAHAGAAQRSTAQHSALRAEPGTGRPETRRFPARPGAWRRAHQRPVLRLRLSKLRDAVHALALHAEQRRLGDRAAGLLDPRDRRLELGHRRRGLCQLPAPARARRQSACPRLPRGNELFHARAPGNRVRV